MHICILEVNTDEAAILIPSIRILQIKGLSTYSDFHFQLYQPDIFISLRELFIAQTVPTRVYLPEVIVLK